MELKCEVTHKPECSYGKLQTSTSYGPSKACDCGADRTIAFINYQAMIAKQLSDRAEKAEAEVERLKDLARSESNSDTRFAGELQESREKLKGVAGARDYYRNILIKSEAQNKVLHGLLNQVYEFDKKFLSQFSFGKEIEQTLKETAMNEPIEQTNDHYADLLEYLESKGTPGQLAEAFEQAEEENHENKS